MHAGHAVPVLSDSLPLPDKPEDLRQELEISTSVSLSNVSTLFPQADEGAGLAVPADEVDTCPIISACTPNHLSKDSDEEQCHEVKGKSPSHDAAHLWDLPKVPVYPVMHSRITPNQLKAIDWMTAAGKRQFEIQQDIVLAKWGVNSQHKGTCVLVPMI
jgi:hypothetical protein